MPCPVAFRSEGSTSALPDAVAGQERLEQVLGCARSEAARASRLWQTGCFCSAAGWLDSSPALLHAGRKLKSAEAQIRLHATVARCWSLPDSLVRLTRVRPQFHRNATARHALGAHCHQSCLLVTAALPSHRRTHSTRQHGGKLQPTSDSAQSYTHAFWLMIRLHDRSTGSCSSAARARCAWPSGSPPCRPRRSSRSPRT